MRRQPLAVLGSVGSIAIAAAAGIARRARASRKAEARLDEIVDRAGGRIDRLRGMARKQFRKQLRKEMAQVEATGPREVAVKAVSGALTALATTMAAGFARRLLRDEHDEAGR